MTKNATAGEIEKLRERIDLLTAELQHLQVDAELWETLCKELEETVFKARRTLAVVQAARELVLLRADQELWESLCRTLNDLDSSLSP